MLSEETSDGSIPRDWTGYDECLRSGSGYHCFSVGELLHGQNQDRSQEQRDRLQEERGGPEGVGPERWRIQTTDSSWTRFEIIIGFCIVLCIWDLLFNRHGCLFFTFLLFHVCILIRFVYNKTCEKNKKQWHPSQTNKGTIRQTTRLVGGDPKRRIILSDLWNHLPILS